MTEWYPGLPIFRLAEDLADESALRAAFVARTPAPSATAATNLANLQAALDAALAAGIAVVDGGGRTYPVSGTLTVDSVTLQNITLSLTGVDANVRMTGEKPTLRRAVLAADDSTPTDPWSTTGGIINLVTVSKALIDDVEVTAEAARRAVQCTTLADYTRINALRTHTAWGILFNDTAFIDRSNIEGVDYTGIPIGTGLTVTDSDFFGPPNAAWTGDAVEVNTPTERFSNVTVLNSRVWRTYTSSNVGIGLGFANVDHLTVDGCYLVNVPSPAGAIHSEHCTDVKITNNTAKNCRVGIDVTRAITAKISGNVVDSCWEFGIKSANEESVWGDEDCRDISIVDNTFVGLNDANGVTAFYDIVVGNLAYVTIARNKFMGFGKTGLTHIGFLDYGSPAISVTHAQVRDNIFANTTGFAATDLISIATSATGLRSSGNDFTTYTGPAAVFCHRIALYGICEDFFRTGGVAVSAAKGMELKTGGTPQGYVTGAAGRSALDVVNGVRYKYDATAAAWSIPGSAYSNPINLGGAFLWVNAGVLRIKATAPTSATDGTVVGAQT